MLRRYEFSNKISANLSLSLLSQLFMSQKIQCPSAFSKALNILIKGEETEKVWLELQQAKTINRCLGAMCTNLYTAPALEKIDDHNFSDTARKT